MNKIKLALEKMQETLDLKKKFPGYFNQWVFRFAIFLMVMIFGFVAYQMDFNIFNIEQVDCNINSPTACKNPFYFCKYPDNPTNETYFFGYSMDFDCNSIKDVGCPEGICEIPYVKPGQSIGRGVKYNSYGNYFYLIIALAFVVNHILYLIRKRRNKHE